MLGLDRIIGVAPRLSDYHGLPNLRDPISSSYYPSAISSAWFVVGFQELRWDCCGIIAMGFYDCDCVVETVLSCYPSVDCYVWICAWIEEELSACEQAKCSGSDRNGII